MSDLLWSLGMRILPKRRFSRLVGRLVRLHLPAPLDRLTVSWFARAYGIDTAEAELPMSAYPTVGAFFTRRLKPGARPIGEGILHPADALITSAGRVESQTLIQAKGKTYTVAGLLGGERFAPRFEGGSFFTYYLCPTDYHRVHAPADGKIVWGRHNPGALWPVNPRSVDSVDGLFVANERIAAVVETAKGLAGFVMVAATNVGDMSVTFDAGLGSKVRDGESVPVERDYAPGIPVRRGEEMGVFAMGSTVIMLYEKGVIGADPESFRGRRVKVGESFEKTGA